MGRKRRSFSSEYKAEVVSLVRQGDRSIGEVSRELDLTESAVRNWVRQAEIDEQGGGEGALSTAERQELAKLRRENARLRMERDILKNVWSAPNAQDEYRHDINSFASMYPAC